MNTKSDSTCDHGRQDDVVIGTSIVLDMIDIANTAKALTDGCRHLGILDTSSKRAIDAVGYEAMKRIDDVIERLEAMLEAGGKSS